MRVVRNSLIPIGRRYGAINLFGILFAKRGVELSMELVNHERIHTAQMRELLYVGFYILYVAEWIVRLFQHNGRGFESYLAISFEKEAYENGGNLDYLSSRRHFAQWCCRKKRA